MNVAKEVEVTITGGETVQGKASEKAGYLSGYSRTVTGSIYGNITTMKNAPARKKLSWIIKADEGTEITVSAAQEKSGQCSCSITL